MNYKFKRDELKIGQTYLLNYSGFEIIGTLVANNKDGLFFNYKTPFTTIERRSFFLRSQIIKQII
jgi:hypothetical protein